MGDPTKRNADHEVLFPPGAIAWIVEPPVITWVVEPGVIAPAGSAAKPYLTLKAHVAERRYKSGDHVTPYISKVVAGGCGPLHDAVNDEEDL